MPILDPQSIRFNHEHYSLLLDCVYDRIIKHAQRMDEYVTAMFTRSGLGTPELVEEFKKLDDLFLKLHVKLSLYPLWKHRRPTLMTLFEEKIKIFMASLIDCK